MLDEVLEAGRAMAEQLMDVTCTVYRLSAGEDADGIDTTVETAIYGPGFDPYRGKCKVQTFEPYEQNLVVVGNPNVLQRYSVHFPWGAVDLEVGDLIWVAGRKHDLRVVALFDKTHATALRVACEEVSNAQRSYRHA